MADTEVDIDFNDSDEEEVDAEVIYSDSDDTQNDSDKQDADEVVEIHDTADALVSSNGSRWLRQPTERATQRLLTRVIIPSGAEHTRSAQTPLEHSQLFITSEILKIIVHHTNTKIQELAAKFSRPQRYAPATDAAELLALIGLLFYSGVTKGARQSSEDMWSAVYGVPIFRLTMSRNSGFMFLLRALRFDNFLQRNKEDKLSPIRQVWSAFVLNSVTNYNPSNHLTVDETILGTRARCPFKTYMKSKPDKYGIKLYNVCDPRTGYLCNSVPYLGKTETESRTSGRVQRGRSRLPATSAHQPSRSQSRGGTRQQRGRSNPRESEGQLQTDSLLSKTTRYVLQLVRPYHNTGRTITCDNYFTSMELCTELRKINLFIVGTLRRNKPKVPEELKKCGRVFSQMTRFAFQNDRMLVSFVPRPQKVVLLLSSAHSTNTIDEVTNKSIVILDYNAQKGGVDTFDALMKNKSTARGSRRWPMRMFFCMLDAAGINAHVLQNLKREIDRTEFLKILSFQLVEQRIRRRNENIRVPLTIRLQIREFLQKGGKTTRKRSHAASENEAEEVVDVSSRPTQACAICATIQK